MKVLEVKNAVKSFKNKKVLKGINFSMNENEILGFLGRNGAGKSTLMKLTCGLLNLDDGDILLMGESIKNNRVKVLENLGVSIENPALYNNLTGRENLKLMANWRKVDKKRLSEMEEYSRLEHNLDRIVSNYSMGMKMRLMMAMVLMAKPKVLLLDEVFNGLDPDGVIELRDELVELKNNGSSILLSSHQLSEVEKISDRIVFIEKGQVVFDGKIDQRVGNENIYRIKTMDNQKIKQALKINIELKDSDKINRENYVEFKANEKNLAPILEQISKISPILDIEKDYVTLEEIYRRIIKN